MCEKRLIWCWIFALTFLSICVSPAADPGTKDTRARLEDYPEYFWVERLFDEVYREAIARAEPHQRVIFEKEHARWFLEREKLKSVPDIYIAYTEQEIRYFRGTYDEP